MSEDAGIEPRTVATLAMAVRRTNQSARSHLLFVYFFVGLECASHSFPDVAHYFLFLRDVWIRIWRAAVASRRATNLATHLSRLFLCSKLLFY